MTNVHSQTVALTLQNPFTCCAYKSYWIALAFHSLYKFGRLSLRRLAEFEVFASFIPKAPTLFAYWLLGLWTCLWSSNLNAKYTWLLEVFLPTGSSRPVVVLTCTVLHLVTVAFLAFNMPETLSSSCGSYYGPFGSFQRNRKQDVRKEVSSRLLN